MGRKKREWEGGRVEGRRGLERILLPYSRAAYVKRFLHSLCLSIPFQHLVFTTSLSLVFFFYLRFSLTFHSRLRLLVLFFLFSRLECWNELLDYVEGKDVLPSSFLFFFFLFLGNSD